jgi:DNA-binding SARP family transcriptional activator
LIQQAVELYRGDLLEGWYMEWCLLERERLQSMYLQLLDKLASYYEASGEYESGLLCGARALRCDRAREHTHHMLMRLHYLAGDRTGALRQFDRCMAALREGLGVSPSERTLELYRQIQAEELKVPQPDSRLRDSAAVERGAASLPAIWPLPLLTNDTPPGGLAQMASG